MKRIFLTIGFLTATFYSTFAQDDSSTPEFGAKAGVNFSNIVGDDVGDLDSRTSFNAGVFMEFPITERFSF
ncbi:hypothetical protein [Subsaxibacter sp. CAU 1640]|uniref:hypothetical protein n=1 Tax=Subsaxibacter sp. CAU 1640 TaxID=2933271 RepID=UPI00293E9A5D|nr:hypothetical protein [Subsaxibacter sp. CAU 1640]